MIAEYNVWLLILWSILMTGMVGSFCFLIWRILSHRMGSQGNAVHIYQWLKVVITLWVLPIVFIAIWVWVSQPNEQGALEGLYFRNTLIKNPVVFRIPVLLWGLMGIIQMSRYVIHWIRHRRTLRGLPRVMDPSWRAEAESIARELGIRRRVDLREVPGIGSPMTVGLTRPIILLDGSIEEQEARRIILYHELYHYKQRDLWWQVWMSVMVCVNWFNPLCYRLHRELREWSEAACDARTCRQGAAEFSPKEYLYQVIAHCRPAKRTGGYFTRAINETGSVESFKNRVDRLFAAMDTWETGGWRYWAKPALYMISAIVFSTAAMYVVAGLRNHTVEEGLPVIDMGEIEPVKAFIVKSGKVDNPPVIEDAPLFPNEDFSFRLDMEDGAAVCRLCPEAEKTALKLIIYGEIGIRYEFEIFTEDGEILEGAFESKGKTELNLEAGKTYYVCVRDKSKSTEDVLFMYSWKDPA